MKVDRRDFRISRTNPRGLSSSIPIVTALAAIFAIVRAIFITTDLFHRRHDFYLSWRATDPWIHVGNTSPRNRSRYFSLSLSLSLFFSPQETSKSSPLGNAKLCFQLSLGAVYLHQPTWKYFNIYITEITRYLIYSGIINARERWSHRALKLIIRNYGISLVLPF